MDGEMEMWQRSEEQRHEVTDATMQARMWQTSRAMMQQCNGMHVDRVTEGVPAIKGSARRELARRRKRGRTATRDSSKLSGTVLRSKLSWAHSGVEN